MWEDEWKYGRRRSGVQPQRLQSAGHVLWGTQRLCLLKHTLCVFITQRTSPHLFNAIWDDLCFPSFNPNSMCSVLFVAVDGRDRVASVDWNLTVPVIYVTLCTCSHRDANSWRYCTAFKGPSTPVLTLSPCSPSFLCLSLKKSHVWMDLCGTCSLSHQIL